MYDSFSLRFPAPSLAACYGDSPSTRGSRSLVGWPPRCLRTGGRELRYAPTFSPGVRERFCRTELLSAPSCTPRLRWLLGEAPRRSRDDCGRNSGRGKPSHALRFTDADDECMESMIQPTWRATMDKVRQVFLEFPRSNSILICSLLCPRAPLSPSSPTWATRGILHQPTAQAPR